MHFSYPQKVLFKHCDPAGIVFYPRFFEMINDAVEAMFDDLLGWPFETIHKDGAVPTKSFDVDFKAPCRHGDNLRLDISITAFGRTSLTLETYAMSEGGLRFTAKQVLVNTARNGRPTPWSDDVRARFAACLETTQ